jgi:hypothetical protein
MFCVKPCRESIVCCGLAYEEVREPDPKSDMQGTFLVPFIYKDAPRVTVAFHLARAFPIDVLSVAAYLIRPRASDMLTALIPPGRGT